MKLIKLCRILYEFPPTIGGSITQTIELAKRMASRCERQIFIVPKVKEDTTELDASFPFEVYRVKYTEFRWLQHIKSRLKWLPVTPLVNFSFGLAAFNKCLKLRKRFGLDIIVVHGIGIGPVINILKCFIKTPVVIVIDGSQESYSHIAGIVETIIIKTTIIDYYFVVDNGGPALAKFKKLLHKKSKLTPFFINIDTNIIYPKEKNIELVKHYNLCNNFVFISVHNLEPVQGVDYSILGFKRFVDKYNVQNAVLLVVGGGSLKDKLERMTDNLNISSKVIFVGPIENSIIPDYYSISDVALSTSIKINMNTSTTEAMACRKAVIAFDCGNTSDMMIKHMQNGILIPAGSIEKLAESMALLYSNNKLRDTLGENALRFVVENRNWKNRIDTELGIYQKLLNKYWRT